MTDHPASWLDDPTGRHDHRYWDGSSWTDHVADAGVAATDPYDGPADATPTAAAPTPSSTTSATDATTTEATTATDASGANAGWAATELAAEEPAPAASPSSISGWGAAEIASTTPAVSEPEPEPEVEPAPEPTPSAGTGATTTGASPWGAPPATSWGTPSPATPVGATTWGTPSSTTPAAEEADAATGADEADVEEPTAVTSVPAASWGAATGVAPSTTWDEPTTTSATSTWGTPLPTPAPDTPAPGSGDGSRKGLLVLCALAAIVVIVAILVVTGDDDGSDTDTGSFAEQFAEQLSSQTQVTDDQAECVGEYVVDEIGPSRLEDLQQLEQRTAPPEIQEDFDQAVQRAFTECEVDQADLQPRAEGTDAGTEGAGEDGGDLGGIDLAPPAGQTMTEAQYQEYFRDSLGLPEEDAACLAQKSAEAEAAGEVQQSDGISQFYLWVEECGIDPEELFQTIQGADSTTASG